METSYSPAFVINLNDKHDRWIRFDNLNLGIERLAAADTRETGFAYEKFGLRLDPADKISKLYFTRSKGAVGCYLSHYEFWKKVVERDLEYALIIEDDALTTDIKSLLTSDTIKPHYEGVTEPKLVQFNKRTGPEKLPYWFNGTECYAVNKRAAQSLINLTHDLSDLSNQFIEYAWSWPKLKCGAYGLFKRWKRHDADIDFITPNTIRYAVDKFIGYCSLSCIDANNRLNIELDPRVGLNPYYPFSDILGGVTPAWEMSFEELVECENDEFYMWWEKG